MSKKQTYEQKLLSDLNQLPPMVWFKIHDRPDCEQLTTAVKGFIEAGEPFMFSNDYRNIRRETNFISPQLYHKMQELPQGVTVETINAGHREQYTIKGQSGWLEHRGVSYRVYRGTQLIAIES